MVLGPTLFPLPGETPILSSSQQLLPRELNLRQCRNRCVKIVKKGLCTPGVPEWGALGMPESGLYLKLSPEHILGAQEITNEQENNKQRSYDG
jgi:hypothetical protein